MSSPVIRVGILGAANIAYQTWGAIHDCEGVRVTYVGCRDAEKGKAFVAKAADLLDIPAELQPAVGSYEEVVSSPEVDAVYIPIPVTARDAWVQQCIEHGKHVIGEKPPAVDAEMLRQWIEGLDAKQLLYMDGTMFSHGRRVKEVCQAVQEELGGVVKHLYCNFSFAGDAAFLSSDIRVNPALEPHGALGDLGWYCIRYILHVMKFQMPTEVRGKILRQSEQGGVVAFAGELTFASEEGKNSTFASFYCAFDTASEQILRIGTTKGRLELADFVHPVSDGEDATFTVLTREEGQAELVPQVRVVKGETTRDQRNSMWRDVVKVLQGGKESSEEARYWATIAWKTQAVMDKLLESARQVPAA